MTGWYPPEPMNRACPEYIGREVSGMTTYEIFMVFLGILALLISFGGLIIAVLTFLERNRKKK